MVEQRFSEWTAGRNPQQARISVYEKIRDIPYAIIPELNDPASYPQILNTGRGSCTPKHLLLADMFGRLGITVLLVVYPFRWEDVGADFPTEVKSFIEAHPRDYHMACMAEIEGELVRVDATIDVPLEKIGLPVNRDWDGFSDTLPAVEPAGEEELFHPSEASFISSTTTDEAHLEFFAVLNSWLDEVRGE
ncbi:MAG: hypothetical protein R6U37_08480 [Dehalococcoidia bacterium]